MGESQTENLVHSRRRCICSTELPWQSWINARV